MRNFAIVMAVALVAAAGRANAADAAKGEKLFIECAACHTLGVDSEGVGPGLKGMFGRKAGAVESYRYSPAFRRSTIVWNAQTLNAYLADPQKEIPGNRMPYSGMPNATDRADLIAYLQNAAK
jgi:cytochrome c